MYSRCVQFCCCYEYTVGAYSSVVVMSTQVGAYSSVVVMSTHVQ